MKPVMTVLEAHVNAERAGDLQAAYRDGISHLEPGIVETYLIRGAKDATLWRILTIWASSEALEKMRSSGETPRGILMFRAAGAEPTLSIFEVALQAASDK